jgi:hypothetical protein
MRSVACSKKRANVREHRSPIGSCISRMRVRSRIEITILSSLLLKIHRQSKARSFESLPNNIEDALNSVRFCRSSGAVTKHVASLVELTVVLSATLNCFFCRWPAGTTLALLLATLKRLASRGGRTRTSTRFPVLGRQFQKGGLHRPPFFISDELRDPSSLDSHPALNIHRA